MRLDELGEFGLIARLTTGLETRPDVLLSVGDDAALLEFGPGEMALVATCDTQVEGRHFIRSVASPEEIGHKAFAVNLSDIAAMGAEPLWALVSLALPASLAIAELDGIYAGLRALARRYEVAIVGGNISGTDGPLTIDVTALGRVKRSHALTRAGGQPGDSVLVTGELGAAAAGVLCATGVSRVMPVSDEALAHVRAAMVAPMPRIAEGQALAESGVVTAMLDISDGLAADLGHLCDASGVGAEVDAGAVPVDSCAAIVARAAGRDPLDLALTGGEDYELLFTVRPDAVQTAMEAVQRVGGRARVIGQLTEPGAGMRVRDVGGQVRPLASRGWDHLRRPDAGSAADFTAR